MNDYSIGSMEPEEPMLEEIKDAISDEATRLCDDCGSENVLTVLIHAYQFYKEHYRGGEPA